MEVSQSLGRGSGSDSLSNTPRSDNGLRERRKKSVKEKVEMTDQGEESEKETKGSDWRKNEIENKAIIKNRKKILGIQRN